MPDPRPEDLPEEARANGVILRDSNGRCYRTGPHGELRRCTPEGQVVIRMRMNKRQRLRRQQGKVAAQRRDGALSFLSALESMPESERLATLAPIPDVEIAALFVVAANTYGLPSSGAVVTAAIEAEVGRRIKKES